MLDNINCCECSFIIDVKVSQHLYKIFWKSLKSENNSTNSKYEYIESVDNIDIYRKISST
jgi:hypothetical protein